MAPRLGRATPRQLSHAPLRNGDVPPSTLAAQIADRLVTNHPDPQNQDRESFQLLLQEIIEANDDTLQPDGNIGKDTAVSSRLICVIIRAGLGTPKFSLPVDEQRQRIIVEVVRSLQAIDLTLSRCPAALFHSAGAFEPGIAADSPLFAWLIPRVLNEVRELECRDIEQHVLGILKRSILVGESTGPRSNLLSSIEDKYFSKDGPSIHFQSAVPASATISEMFPEQYAYADGIIPFQITPRTMSHAFTIILLLLSGFLPQIDKVQTEYSRDRHLAHLRFILSSLGRLWTARTSNVLSLNAVPDTFLEAYVRCLRHLLLLLFRGAATSTDISKGSMLLCRILFVILGMEPPASSSLLETELCQALFDVSSLARHSVTVLQLHTEILLPKLSEIVDSQDRFPIFGDALQHAIVFTLRHENHEKHNDISLETPEFGISHLPTGTSRTTHPGEAHIDISDHEFDGEADTGPRKRFRLGSSTVKPCGEDVSLMLSTQIFQTLGLPETADLADAFQTITHSYSDLNETNQCKLLFLLGQMACAGAQSLFPSPSTRRQQSAKLDCAICDSQLPRKPQITRSSSTTDSNSLINILANLSKLPQVSKFGKPRVAIMLATRRVLSHCGKQVHLDLTASVLGQCCLQALRSSSRDLRIAAGRTLPCFLRGDLEDVMLRRNSVSTLEFLRTLSEKSELALQETCILAWAQVARVSSGDEMNIVLLRLVEYLGHTNPLVCGLAYDEIQRMCQHSSLSAHRMLAPYWRTLAPTVVQDIQRRPQTAQNLSDLLSVTVSELLRLTQIHTLPYFVSTKQRELLQRIADACNRSIKEICMEPVNIAAILAYILLRSPGEAEITSMTAFKAVSSEFNHFDCAGILNAEPLLIAVELLKTAGDADESTKSKAFDALYSLASLNHGRHGTPRGSARKLNMIGAFFETHALGIMAHLSDTINDSKGTQVTAEKLRCLKAIQELIKLAKNHINNALPQISACLRSALEITELCNEAFIGWTAMIGALDADDMLALIDQTFAIVVQYWDSFTPNSQTKAYDMISQLLRTHATSIREMAHTIPSLASIPLMAKFEGEISNVKLQMVTKHQLQALIQRSRHENLTVVQRALTELEVFLENNQDFLHNSSISEHPEPVISELARTLLDITVQYGESSDIVVALSARCIGLLGCLDPTRTEAPRRKKELLVLSNFQEAEETIDFVVFFLREILVKAFLSATNLRAQGFLAYTMQELLKFCGLNGSLTSRNQEGYADPKYLRWVTLPESVRNTLTPFLNSRYVVTPAAVSKTAYPIYRSTMAHGQWLRAFVYDLLRKGHGDNITELFQVFSRIIRIQNTSIPTFLLPFAVLNTLVSGSEHQQLDVGGELLAVLSHPLPDDDIAARNNLLHCSQNIFQILDYLTRWMQEKKKGISLSSRLGRSPSSNDVEIAQAQINNVESVVHMLPAEIISRRAVECKSYSRALFYWEQYIRQQRPKDGSHHRDEDMEPFYERLQQIYTQIDEPDGIEGISSHLQVLNIDQQILEHRKAGRWTAAQSWYELLLSERPRDTDVQCNLLTCLKESGQHGTSTKSQNWSSTIADVKADVLLNQIDGFEQASAKSPIALPFACEASWVTGKWNRLEEYLKHASDTLNGNFNIGVGRALLALARNEKENFAQIVDDVRRRTAKSLSTTNIASLQACHDVLLKLHALTEIEAIGGIRKHGSLDKVSLSLSLEQRLDLLGAFNSDKQFLLGLRRAAMHLSRDFSNNDIASAWLTSAKLARKAGFTHQSFNAVLHASQLGDNSATIEHSRLLWKEGHHRKAIQSLKGAIAANAFQSHAYLQTEQPATISNNGKQQEQNAPKARAHLLLAKWIDGAGQTQSDPIIQEYRLAIRWHSRWEKAHYYLGKHYNKLLEHEKAKMTAKRAQTFLSGEMAKLVVENYIRSLAYGAKYIHQTLPRALTLWLELGVDAEQPLESRHGTDEFRAHTAQQRRKMLTAVNAQVKKYSDRLPGFVFYTALSQIVARIVHPNPAVFPILIEIVAKVVSAHPQQALWTLLAVVKSSSKDRAIRGKQCLDRINEHAKKSKNDADGKELKAMITHGQKLSDQLLHVCEGDIHGKPSTISLTRDLGFVHKTAPCKLVVPLESTLTASLPPGADSVEMKKHRAFAKDTVTISAFIDNVLVLNSLQKPRKITIRGSDGHVYGLLCKPKDDLRKDQRLMEFNTMINRFLKKDAESSHRRLYIKTYAVTPLNEECGLIEWIDNLKTLREILLNTYRQKNIIINYTELKLLLNEACSSPSKTDIFTDQIIPRFPPVFHEWFVDMFPEPGAWFTARLRYTRSCAVMSIVGHVLGLGDRHGENILFEEGNGGTFHVDFNCLFDKGLSFEKPELVPFRLTHNMVDAFGAYGCEGPFRKSCELTLRILRQHEDTLMTILETFLYDPTTDFIGKKKKKGVEVASDTPQGVLDSVRNKVRGLLPMESVPLSVEGYVEELVKQATDPEKLAAMYIGWCAFF
ncbi:MAG: hypothetical protein Q9166_004627 [cf. Caloplaca sp. 2 TL-2023]